MFSKILAICATLSAVSAGNLIQAPQLAYSSAPAVSSVYQSTVSAPSKTIAYAAPAIQTYAAAPAIHTTYAAPAIQTYAAAPALHTTYAAPAIKTYAAPAVQTYAAPIAKVAYSAAPSVSHVYNSVAAPSAIAYAPAHIGYSSPAIGTTHQSTVRSFDGTISHHSKAIDTAFSSVRKSDTRISNNLYTPALATKSIAYAAPVATKTLAYSAPVTYAAPATYAAHATYAAPAHAAISYSAAPLVSHVSFEGTDAHYGW